MFRRLIDYIRRPFSLRRHLVMASSAIIFVGVFAAIVVVMLFIYRTERAVWESRELDAVRNASNSISSFIRQVQDYCSVVGLLDEGTLLSDPQLIVDLLYENDALLEMVRLNQQGEVVAGAYRQGTTPTLINLFTTAQATWFIQANHGSHYIGSLQVSADDEPYIILAVPAAAQGVVAVRLRMDVLWEVVSGIHFGETGQVYVVNRPGYVIAHPDERVVLARTDISSIPELQSILQAGDDFWQGTYHSFNEQQVLGTMLQIEDSNWVVFTEIQLQEALTTTRNAVVSMGGGVLLSGIIVTAALSWLMQTLVFTPVKALRDGAVQVGRGDLTHRVASRSQNEIGQVASAFDEMAAQLQEREAALAQARDEALAASTFKSRLLANVSHDLMTPLNGVLGYAEMLNEGVYGALTEKQNAVVERIFNNSQRLINLIRSLLDQARIEAGRIEIHAAPFQPGELIEHVVAVMGILAERKNLELRTVVSPDLPPRLMGDFQRLQQILMNLVGNAIKFTDHGGILVRFFITPQQEHWGIQVSDTGRGIDAAAQRMIFEPFRRVDHSTTRETEGVGLGLSIVHQLVGAMGGKIDLESTLGQGSTFTILLPLKIEGEI